MATLNSARASIQQDCIICEDAKYNIQKEGYRYHTNCCFSVICDDCYTEVKEGVEDKDRPQIVNCSNCGTPLVRGLVDEFTESYADTYPEYLQFTPERMKAFIATKRQELLVSLQRMRDDWATVLNTQQGVQSSFEKYFQDVIRSLHKSFGDLFVMSQWERDRNGGMGPKVLARIRTLEDVIRKRANSDQKIFAEGLGYISSILRQINYITSHIDAYPNIAEIEAWTHNLISPTFPAITPKLLFYAKDETQDVDEVGQFVFVNQYLQDDIKQGRWLEYENEDGTGALLEDVMYDDDLPEGRVQKFDKEGRLVSDQTLKDGKIIAERKYDNAIKLEEKNCETNGRLRGLNWEKYPNGQIKWIGYYDGEDGYCRGDFLAFYEDGKIDVYGYWDGEGQGTGTHWKMNPDGTVQVKFDHQMTPTTPPDVQQRQEDTLRRYVNEQAYGPNWQQVLDRMWSTPSSETIPYIPDDQVIPPQPVQ